MEKDKMEVGGFPSVAMKKAALTPKAIIFQRFGGKAVYKVEEVQESTPNGCPGLAISHKGPCLYRCHLQLPEFYIVSEIFKRKKDAEQNAAEKAIEKLGIDPRKSNPTVQEAWDELVSRLSYLFSNEFFPSFHPLSGHFRAALQREGHLNGLVPVSVMAIYDSKLINLCKYINPDVESKPLEVMSIVMSAAARLPGTVSASEEQLSLRRTCPYPPEIVQSLADEPSCRPDTCVKAIRVPYLVEKTNELLTLNVSVKGYYLDAIAHELGSTDASKVLISRSIGKASSETRLYFSDPKSYKLDAASELDVKEAPQSEGYLNARASYFSGHDIYGDAILASIGYTWKSSDLFLEDVSSCKYYRILINKIPTGIYKLSREAVLTAELPVVFSTRSKWRGSFPRDILCTFCRQHHLGEPVFSNPLESSLELSGSRKKLKDTVSGKEKTDAGSLYINGRDMLGSGECFRCEVKIYSKCQDLIIRCSPKESFNRQSDAIQNASLKVLSWLNKYFKQLNMPLEKLTTLGDEFDIQFYPQHFFKEFAFCPRVHTSWQSTETNISGLLESNGTSQSCEEIEDRVCSFNIDGPDSGVSLSSGSLVCISYSIYLVREGEDIKELLESSEEFEFEIGIEAVIPRLEAVVTQMEMGQSACFSVELPPQELIFAAHGDPALILSLLSSRGCSLEYSTTLLRVTEPMEDRMEKALFSPPLSKQRVEYAVQHIKESCASYLVDFGCGSGSLLDSLLEYPSSLEKIVGVDISQKSLARAAKTLHSKLSTSSTAVVPGSGINSALLYDGSITSYDSRLYGCDIGTCLEVIEHMEEDQACLFGHIVLSSFCPKILIVSTPNYEYNVILQQSTVQNLEDEPEEKNQTQACKFRNHDHKFEWTREQFRIWASDLAKTHNYTVEFSGVGGEGGVEPGFASQIAVFRREGDLPQNEDSTQHYKVIWEWSRANISISSP